MRTNYIFLLCSFIFSSVVFAQSTYKSGFIVTISGDTLQGFIEYRQWDINPYGIRFKKAIETSSPVTYTVNDLSYFEIPGFDRYIRAVVRKDLRPVETNELLKNFIVDTTITDTVLLRTLVDSKISLFELEEEKTHFYLRDDKEQFHELLYKVYLENSNSRISKRYIFRDQFNQWIDPANKSASLAALIARAEYEEKDLVRIVEKMNEGKNAAFAYQVKKIKQPVSFYIGAGGVFSTLRVRGKETLERLKYSNSFSPSFVGGVDVSLAKSLQRLFLRFEVGWYALQYDGTNNSKDPLVTYKLKLSSVMPSISVLYNAINLTKHKVYLGAGIGLNFSNFKDNTLAVTNQFAIPAYKETDDYMEFEKKWLSMQARVGYLYNKRVELAGSLKFRGSFSNYSAIVFKTPITGITVNYHF